MTNSPLCPCDVSGFAESFDSSSVRMLMLDSNDHLSADPVYSRPQASVGNRHASPSKSESAQFENHRSRAGLSDILRWHGKRMTRFAIAAFFACCIWLTFVAKKQFVAESKIYIPTPSSAVASAGIKSDSNISGSIVRDRSGERDSFVAMQCSLFTSGALLQHVGEAIPHPEKIPTLALYQNGLEAYFRSHTTVGIDDHNAIIQITVAAKKSDDAVTLVRALVDTYMRYQTTALKTVASELLQGLQKSSARKNAELAITEKSFRDLQKEDSDFDATSAVSTAQRRVQMLSEQLTAAQMKTLAAEHEFAANHPQRRAALAFETEVQNALNDALDQVASVHEKITGLQRIQTQVSDQRTFISQLNSRIREVEFQRDAELSQTGVTVVEPGRLLDASLATSPVRALAVWTGAGLCIGLLFSIFKSGTDPRIDDGDDVREALDIDVLGYVPFVHKRRSLVGKAMAVHLDPRGATSEAFRSIRTSLLISERPPKTILITSPDHGDGKSLCATNLSLALARAGRTVLLIDGDLRKPAQHLLLDLPEGSGLAEAIASPASLRFAIRATGIDNLYTLPAGSSPTNPSELFDNPNLSTLFTDLRAKFDHLIVDSPPVNASTDATALATICDAVVLVVRSEETRTKSAEAAAARMRAAGGRVAGAIINAARLGDRNKMYSDKFYAPVDSALRDPTPAGS